MANDAVFIFLAVSWGDLAPTWDGEGYEAFGPFIVREDGSHMSAIEETVKGWRRRHPERPNVALHLFATEPTSLE